MCACRIDAHQHFWVYDPIAFAWLNEDMKSLRRDFLPPDLEPLIRNYEMDGTIAVQARQSEEETDFLLDLAEKYPNIVKGVVGWLDIRSPTFEDRLKHYSRNEKLVGIRHIVQDEPDDHFLLQESFINGIKLLKKYHLTYDILIYPKHLSVANSFVELFPDQPFVIDHIAKPFIKDHIVDNWEEGIRKLASHSNVFIKVSGMVTEADWQNWREEDFTAYLDIVFDAFGCNRIMIGSDWPMMTLCGKYHSVMDIVKKYISKFSEEEQSMVMGKTAKQFYNISICIVSIE